MKILERIKLNRQLRKLKRKEEGLVRHHAYNGGTFKAEYTEGYFIPRYQKIVTQIKEIEEKLNNKT